ncbi:beta-lactamase/transpeptidase-like protein [Lineolata rhizophorae]|uniref:Beta-lactamase/transpeptidase-like protein n=1 Tax=Lineolata rhizophorae TaxID=578093 RepID=A0A6A6NY97_9PEZI|nr:beta-lactamase/transpeptidase-like protein [Lineolata rhizophorae]
MESLSALLEKATRKDAPSLVAPAIVASVVNRDGKIDFMEARGIQDVDGTTEITPDSVFWIASQTKLVGTVAAMQAVEKGLIGLDDEISESGIVPELASKGVLEDGKERTRKNKLTLRLLLTHQSGDSYMSFSPALTEYAKANGKEELLDDTSVNRMTQYPLTFEPGTSWVYGLGIDWAAEIVARLHKTTFEEYCKQHIWGPLGMNDTTFSLDSRPDMKARRVQAFKRNEADELEPSPLPYPDKADHALAGHGLWSTNRDYTKFLKAILNDGRPILKKESVDEMFKPQMVPSSKPVLDMLLKGPMRNFAAYPLALDTEIDYGLSGILNTTDIPGRHAAGSLQWSGLPNLLWWIDRKTGIAATIFQQTLPPGDLKSISFNTEFENALYKVIKGT